MKRYHARWVLPVCTPAVRDGTVVVDGERIAWVGARSAAPPGDDIELGDAILLPGLVNAHIHLDLAAFAGAFERGPFFPWVRALVRTLADATDVQALADASRWSVADQLAHGVTTMAHTGPLRVAFDAMREFGARGIAYLETFGPDPAQCDASLADLSSRVGTARRDETALVHVGVSPHAPYSVSDALYAGVAHYARAEELPVAVHIAESADESHLVADGTGDFAAFLRGRSIDVASRASSPLALLARTGVLAARPLCIHVVQTDAHEIRRLADAGATVAHCPRANAWFGHGSAPISAMRAAGVPIGLGTDSIASNDAVRVLAEAADAADGSLTPAERIALATRGGAHALGLGASVGVLAPGMAADLTAFGVTDIVACDADPAQYLLQRSVNSPAALTMVAGVVRARDGIVTGAAADLDAQMTVHKARVRAANRQSSIISR